MNASRMQEIFEPTIESEGGLLTYRFSTCFTLTPFWGGLYGG
jgi:hypothetical protein